MGYAPIETTGAARKNILRGGSRHCGAPSHEQLVVLMDVNACTGKRGEGGVRRKDNGVLGGYDRDALNGSGEDLLSFSANHGLALVKPFFSTRKTGA